MLALVVEDSYDGPRFDGEITTEFVLAMLERFKQQKSIHRKYAYKVQSLLLNGAESWCSLNCFFQILSQIKALLYSLPTMLEIPVAPSGKLTVCGDTHGQFYDLMNIFALNGLPSETNPYLFNGDFVDRGSFSVETMFTMFAFKLLLPDHYMILRGNHETINLNKVYGFEGEVKHKYAAKIVLALGT